MFNDCTKVEASTLSRKRKKGIEEFEALKVITMARETSPPSQRSRYHVKSEVCAEVIRKLTEAGNDIVKTEGFAEDLQAHFNRLPTRYALDVNTERAEDVLTHKNLLKQAESDNKPAFYVRAVHVLPGSSDTIEEPSPPSSPMQVISGGVTERPPKFKCGSQIFSIAMSLLDKWIRLAPSFSSTPTCQDHISLEDIGLLENYPLAPTHEVCFSTIDKPKLLSQLSSLLADVGLNIREAHAFSTVDGYSLDVFVVDGWQTEDTKDLREELERKLAKMEDGVWSKSHGSSPKKSPPETPMYPGPSPPSKLKNKNDTNDWEIDTSQLKLASKLASGAFGNLYRGTYCGQDVAIKVLKPEHLSERLQHEFEQEIFIMRKVRHKNVVQFIGACTRPPKLSIVTEFMSGGNVYDFLHKHKVALKLPMIVRISLDISKGMDYLHQNNIIHRDLKAANLLMDENEVVKVADFGVARIQDQRGIMTAETGTYRWMAPEVIQHNSYDRKVDVFSFGIVVWELLTGKLPMQNCRGASSSWCSTKACRAQGLRPTIPKHTNPKIVDLLERCWKADPTERPEFSQITVILQEILKEADDDELKRGEKKDFCQQ